MLEIWSSFYVFSNTAHRIPSSHDKHDKVSCINLFVMPTSLTKFESFCTCWNLKYQVWPSFCVLSAVHIQVAWQSRWRFWCLLFEPSKRKRLSNHRIFLRKFNIFKIHRYVIQLEYQYLWTCNLLILSDGCFINLLQ